MDINPAALVTALGRLPEAEQQRFRAEFDAWLSALGDRLRAARRGARIAPAYRRPLHEQLQAESDRRAQTDDRTWIAWDVWAAAARRAA